MAHPTPKQREFFDDIIDGQGGTVLTLKRVEGLRKGETRGFSVNIRGPFVLETYRFDRPGGGVVEETVIDAEWARAKAKASGTQESDGHLHCPWDQWNFAVLSATNDIVRQNIRHDFQLAFFRDSDGADAYAAAGTKDNNTSLFWFYLETENHVACRYLPRDTTIVISEWPRQSLCR